MLSLCRVSFVVSSFFNNNSCTKGVSRVLASSFMDTDMFFSFLLCIVPHSKHLPRWIKHSYRVEILASNGIPYHYSKGILISGRVSNWKQESRHDSDSSLWMLRQVIFKDRFYVNRNVDIFFALIFTPFSIISLDIIKRIEW